MKKFLDIRNYLAAFNYWVLVCKFSGTFRESYSKNAEEESIMGDLLVHICGFSAALVWMFPFAVYCVLQKVYTKIMYTKIS